MLRYIYISIYIGSHDSDSLLGTTRVVSGARMLYNVLGRLVANGLPKGSKAGTKRWIDITNEAQHGGIREVSLERAEEKNSVDRLDPVCSFHHNNHIRAKKFYVHNSRHAAATLLKYTRNVS